MTADPQMGKAASMPTEREVRVWDLPVRVFHWSLVVLVVTSWITGDDDGRGFSYALHTYAGYGVFLLVLFRALWGLIGSETARFASFVTGWRPVARQLGHVIRFKGEKTLGHTPAGGWMIVALLGLLLVIAVTGILAAAKEPGALLSAIVPVFLARGAAGVHNVLGENIILLLVLIHVAGVLVESALSRQNLIRAMFTGRKWTADPDARDVRFGSLAVAIFLAVLFLMLGVWMVSNTQF